MGVELLMRNVIPDAIHSERGVVRYWSDLKEVLSKKQTGFIFLRQKPLHRFIADFYCSELGLVIEIDGDSHDKKKNTDKLRDKFLLCLGIRTIRFTNEEVLNNINYVKSVLKVSLVKGRFRGIEKDG